MVWILIKKIITTNCTEKYIVTTVYIAGIISFPLIPFYELCGQFLSMLKVSVGGFLNSGLILFGMKLET